MIGFTLTEKEKTLHIIYWIQKIHKNLVGFYFIIASKLYSTKKILRSVSHIFKLIYSQTETFHKDSFVKL